MTDLRDAARDSDGSPAQIASYLRTDAAYRLNLPADLTLTGAVFNVADRDPPAVRLTDYNYDSLFGQPAGPPFQADARTAAAPSSARIVESRPAAGAGRAQAPSTDHADEAQQPICRYRAAR